jgi:hypothetical protein
MLFRRRRCSWTGCERPAERGHRGLCLEHHDEIIEAHGKIAAGELDAEEYAATLPSDEGEALLAVHGVRKQRYEAAMERAMREATTREPSLP